MRKNEEKMLQNVNKTETDFKIYWVEMLKQFT